MNSSRLSLSSTSLLTPRSPLQTPTSEGYKIKACCSLPSLSSDPPLPPSPRRVYLWAWALMASCFAHHSLVRLYSSTPPMAMTEPMAARGVSLDLNTMMEVAIRKTRLKVLPTAWVTGCTTPRHRKATSSASNNGLQQTRERCYFSSIIIYVGRTGEDRERGQGSTVVTSKACRWARRRTSFSPHAPRARDGQTKMMG